MDEEYQLNNLGNRLKTWVAGWGATRNLYGQGNMISLKSGLELENLVT